MNKPDQADMDRPFPGLPICRRYAAIGPIEEARQRICRMLDRGEALGVVMGPPGTGKTLLCQKLAALYSHSHGIVRLGEMRVSSRLGLIQQVLFHLGKPHQGVDEESLHLGLIQSLTKTAGGLRPLLLIIDEAQMLSADLLDEIRMMTNLVRGGRPMVQTLLVGGPQLENTLVDPQLESLTQRIAVRCYLHPMNHGETDQYVRAAMSAMTLPIDDQAIASVHHASGGIPRLINQLMDQAIEVACRRQMTRLDDACVQIAWAELQQLPSPVLDAELRPQGTAIEFGELDSDAFDFENEATPIKPALPPTETFASEELPSPYADIASILHSTSIDCLSQAPQESSIAPCSAAASGQSLEPDCEAAAPAPPQSTPATLAMQASERWSTPGGDELFGVDFDQEMPLNIASTQVSSRLIDPAQEELSLHEEIRQLSAAAESIFADTHAQDGGAELPGLWNNLDPTVPHSPACDVPEELACPLAIVWSDDDVAAPQRDDRDMLVIEDDVTMMIDTPQGGFIASGAMRKPPQDVDQNYQNLFSRLRGGQ